MCCENAGILCVFQAFRSKFVGEMDRQSLQTQLCGVALEPYRTICHGHSAEKALRSAKHARSPHSGSGHKLFDLSKQCNIASGTGIVISHLNVQIAVAVEVPVYVNRDTGNT